MRLSNQVGAAILAVAGACAPACAQGLIEYGAAAAAGSSIGAASGKKVNEGLDSVLKKASGAAEKSARSTEAAPAPGSKRLLPEVHLYPTAPEAEQGPVGGAGSSPVASPRTSVRPPRASMAGQTALPASPAMARVRVNTPPSRPLPTAADFETVAVGMSRDEVLQKLGSPSSRMMIPEDGKMIEIYRFASTSGELGSVRLVDGTVETVKK